MKLRWLAGPALVLIFLAGQTAAQEASALKDQKDKLSYSLGVEIAKNLKQLQGYSVELNQDLVLQGVKDAFSGGKTLMSDEEIKETLSGFQKEMIAKQKEAFKKLGEKNKAEGEAFLAENKKKEGVVTLASGLQYKVITSGSDKKPKPTDTVKVHYKGTLINGTEFDSSYRHGEPAGFQVNTVIPGWTEALELMGEGAKWQVFIPSNLAYGERGAGGQIGPNATLIFEIELISIEEQK